MKSKQKVLTSNIKETGIYIYIRTIDSSKSPK